MIINPSQPRDERGRWVRTKKKSTKRSRRAKLKKQEYTAVSSGIFTDHPNLPIGIPNQYYEYGDYFYTFEVVDWGVYKFDIRLKIVGHEEKIAQIKELYKEWN